MFRKINPPAKITANEIKTQIITCTAMRGFFFNFRLIKPAIKKLSPKTTASAAMDKNIYFIHITSPSISPIWAKINRFKAESP